MEQIYATLDRGEVSVEDMYPLFAAAEKTKKIRTHMYDYSLLPFGFSNDRINVINFLPNKKPEPVEEW